MATWPFFGTFTLGTLVAGFVLSVSLRSWNTDHPETVAVPERTLRSEINMAAIPVRGDAGGLFFAIGSVAILLALPQLRWFLVVSMVSAALAGFALIVWRQGRVFSDGCDLSIDAHHARASR
jgi:hypothetical protein